MSSFLELFNWRHMNTLAATARQNRVMAFYAMIVAIGLNILGVVDIALLYFLLDRSAPILVNPFLEGMIGVFPVTWVHVALMLQLMTTASILWYPNSLFLILVGMRIFMTFFVVIHNIGFVYTI